MEGGGIVGNWDFMGFYEEKLRKIANFMEFLLFLSVSTLNMLKIWLKIREILKIQIF